MGRRSGDARGFTLIEVLCAFLVLSLSAALLFAGIGAAGSINRQARDSQRKFYEELSLAEGQTGAGTEDTVRFYEVSPDSGAVDSTEYGTRPVNVYAERAEALSSYRLR